MNQELPPFVLEAIQDSLLDCKNGVEREGDKFFGPPLDVVYSLVFKLKRDGDSP